MSLHLLAKPINDAQNAVRRMNQQASDVQRLLEENAAAPQVVKDEARQISEELADISQGFDEANSSNHVWQIARVWRGRHN